MLSDLTVVRVPVQGGTGTSTEGWYALKNKRVRTTLLRGRGAVPVTARLSSFDARNSFDDTEAPPNPNAWCCTCWKEATARCERAGHRLAYAPSGLSFEASLTSSRGADPQTGLGGDGELGDRDAKPPMSVLGMWSRTSTATPAVTRPPLAAESSVCGGRSNVKAPQRVSPQSITRSRLFGAKASGFAHLDQSRPLAGDHAARAVGDGLMCAPRWRVRQRAIRRAQQPRTARGSSEATSTLGTPPCGPFEDQET